MILIAKLQARRVRTALVAGLISCGLTATPALAQQDKLPDGATIIGGLVFDKNGVEIPRPATERPPYDPTVTNRTIAFYEALIKVKPREFVEQRELAGAYLARLRECGDIADAVRAEQSARKSLEIFPKKNVVALTRLASALLAQHRFPEALAVAQEAAKLDDSALRLIIDIQLELGEYDDADQRMRTITPGTDDFNYLALKSRFAEIHGKPDEALSLMREAATGTNIRPDMPAESVAWFHTMVGHHLIDTGHLDEGVKSCEKALSIFPNDYRAMTGLAEAAAWRSDHANTLKWAEAALKLAPQNPEAIRLAGEALAGMGRKAEADQQFQALRTLAGSFARIYDRHWIVFCLDTDQDLDAALTLARQDLALRHDVGAHDTLAYACLKKGLLDEADREMTLAMAQGTQEANMSHHAALIAEARGDKAKAATLLARAKTLNPYLLKSPNNAEPTHP